MNLPICSNLLRALILSLSILVTGCDSQPAKDFSFVEDSIFPLPVDSWDEKQDEHTRTIKFDCSFEDYAAWLVNLEGYRDMIGLESDEDASRNLPEIVEYLARKEPGEGYQGMYVGVDWLKEDEIPPFAIQISSHVFRPNVVSVKIVSSHL